MGGELARRRANTVAERQLGYDLQALRRRVEMADAEVMAIGHVTRGAVQETMLVGLLCERAMQIAPSGAQFYQFQALAGAAEMAEVIRSVRRRW